VTAVANYPHGTSSASGEHGRAGIAYTAVGISGHPEWPRDEPHALIEDYSPVLSFDVSSRRDTCRPEAPMPRIGDGTGGVGAVVLPDPARTWYTANHDLAYAQTARRRLTR
jgi:hypothetical protein